MSPERIKSSSNEVGAVTGAPKFDTVTCMGNKRFVTCAIGETVRVTVKSSAANSSASVVVGSSIG